MPTREQKAKQEAKRERRFARRAEREQKEEHDRGRRRRRMALYGVAGVAVLAVLAFGYWLAFLQPRPGESVSTYGSGLHTGRPAEGYSTSPPTSGPHSPQVPDWGGQGAVPEPLQVHALEHGGVLVQYNCSPPCPEIVSSLRFITSGYNRGVILAPYDGMDAKIALTSWGKIDLMDEFDRDRVKEFVSKNRGHGPEPIQ